MRVLLLIAMLFLCLPASASALSWPLICNTCPGRCVVYIDGNGYEHAFCINTCPTCTGVWLQAKPQYWPSATSNQTIRFIGDLNKADLASALHEATGWAVDCSAFGIGPFAAGTYVGSVAQIAQAIAATGNASVQVDEVNHKLIFGIQLME